MIVGPHTERRSACPWLLPRDAAAAEPDRLRPRAQAGRGPPGRDLVAPPHLVPGSPLSRPTSRQRLPLRETPFDQCGALDRVAAVQYSQVTRVGAQVDP